MSLAGRHIVITRPVEQAGPLMEAIDARGGIPVLFPVLAIRALADVQPLRAMLTRVVDCLDFDLAVFVSPNAVQYALTALSAQQTWPPQLRAATVGLSSERALARFGVQQILAPRERFDSEALLALPELQAMQGKRVVIFRGDGGRALLGDTLRARGATVEYITCYHRELPRLDTVVLRQLWQQGVMDACVMTSSEGVRNLWQLLNADERRYLQQTRIFVPHARIAEEAQALGLSCVTITGPGDAGLLAGMDVYFA